LGLKDLQLKSLKTSNLGLNRRFFLGLPQGRPRSVAPDTRLNLRLSKSVREPGAPSGRAHQKTILASGELGVCDRGHWLIVMKKMMKALLARDI
jgi:hypothetical protein